MYSPYYLYRATVATICNVFSYDMVPGQDLTLSSSRHRAGTLTSGHRRVCVCVCLWSEISDEELDPLLTTFKGSNRLGYI